MKADVLQKGSIEEGVSTGGVDTVTIRQELSTPESLSKTDINTLTS